MEGILGRSLGGGGHPRVEYGGGLPKEESGGSQAREERTIFFSSLESTHSWKFTSGPASQAQI